jgi:hypothetical protein
MTHSNDDFKIGDKVRRISSKVSYTWKGGYVYTVVKGPNSGGNWMYLRGPSGEIQEGLKINFEKGTDTETQDHKFKVGDHVVGNRTHIMSKRNGMYGKVVGDFTMRGYHVQWPDMSYSLYALETELDHAPKPNNNTIPVLKKTKIKVTSSVVTTQVETRSLDLTSDQVENIVRNWAKDYHGFGINTRIKSTSQFNPVSTVTMTISETILSVEDNV